MRCVVAGRLLSSVACLLLLPVLTFAQTTGGTWKVETQLVGATEGSASVTGNGSASFTPNNGSASMDISASASGLVTNNPPNSTVLPFNATAQNHTVNGNYRIKITWQPKNNDWILDPAPAYAYI